MTIHFYKYQGTGNDFIIINDTEKKVRLSATEIKKLCDRNFGIGSDGLILIRPSKKYNFNMIFYNPNGEKGSMCGNGGRCASAFVFSQNSADQQLFFDAFDGKHQALLADDDPHMITLQMKRIRSLIKTPDYFSINSGSPHYITVVKNLEDSSFVEKAHKICKTFSPEETNVNFIQKKDGKWHMRTYERGVEAETLSCGTGATATAVAIAEIENISHAWIPLKTRGGDLMVYLEKDGENNYKNILLKGTASKVYEGVIEI